MKLNDWIVANINNPDFTANDFKSIGGLDLDNTQFLSKSEYEKSSFIQNNPNFKNEDGSFSKEKFGQFYDLQAEKFGLFSADDGLFLREYSLWDTQRKVNDKILNPDFKLTLIPNPDRVSFGVSGRNLVGERTMSRSEIALTLKIFDTSKGEFLDETPNDRVFFNKPLNFIESLFKDPLVLASWDESGTHIDPITGIEMKHNKGDLKLNDNGTYYTETLNGRSPRGKLFIAQRDLLTIDGTKFNKYIDFLDSDGIKKSPEKVIALTIGAVLPMVLLAPEAVSVYSGLLITRELSKSLPMLYLMFSSLFGNENDSEILNTIAGLGEVHSSSTSEFGKEHMFAFENFGHLISDVALQWGLQRLIAESYNKLNTKAAKVFEDATLKAKNEYIEETSKALTQFKKGQISLQTLLNSTGISSKEELEMIKQLSSTELGDIWKGTIYGLAALRKYYPEAEKVARAITLRGQDLSLAYMAIISNTDVYDTALEHGATKKEAAAIALASTLGMFSVDKYLHLGEVFFDSEKAAEKRAFKYGLKAEQELLIKQLGEQAIGTPEIKLRLPLHKIMKSAMNKSRNFVSDYYDGLKNHSLGFFGKAAGEGIEEVSEELVTDLVKSLGELAGEYGYIHTNDLGAWDEWGPRYLMNFFGGAIGGGLFYGVDVLQHPENYSKEHAKETLIALIKEGKTSDIMQELNRMKKRGLLGNTKLSIKTTEDGSTFLTADQNNLSQNDYIYDLLSTEIAQIDQILNNNDVKLSDDLLFNKLVLNERNYIALKDYLGDISYMSGYLARYLNLIKDLVDIQKQITDLETNKFDDNGKETDVYLNGIQTLLNKKSNVMKDIQGFLSGEYSPYYLEKTLFLMDTKLSSPFVHLSFGQWVKYNTGKSIESLTESEKTELLKKYDAYINSNGRMDADKGFEEYKKMLKKLTASIEELDLSDMDSWEKILEKMEKSWPKPANYDTKLDSESDEEFVKRILQEGESNEEFKKRFEERKKKIEQYNNENFINWVNQFLENFNYIDGNTSRRIQQLILFRAKDILEETALNNIENSKYLNEEGLEILPSVLLLKIIAATGKIFRDLNINGTNKNEILLRISLSINKIIAEDLNEFAILLKEANKVLEIELFPFNELEEDEKQAYDNSEEKYIEAEKETDFKTILENLGYSFELLSTYDFINILKNLNIIDEEGNFINQEDTVDDNGVIRPKTVEELTFLTGYNEIFRSEYAPKTTEESFLKWIKKIIKDEIDIPLNTDADLWKNTQTSNLALNFSEFQDSIEELIDNLLNSPQIKVLNQLNDKLKYDLNPTIKVIKAVADSLGDDFSDIESTLRLISEQYVQGDRISSFILDGDTQIPALKKALQYLDIAKSMTYGAISRLEGNLFIGHNQLVLEFVKAHTEAKNYDLPPVFKTDIGETLIYEYELYQNEIENWIKISDSNLANRGERLKLAEKALYKSRIDFFNNNSFKVNGIDLMNGKDTISKLNDLGLLVALQNLLYKNAHNAVNKGILTWNQIFSELIPSICPKAYELYTSKLDENLEYGKLQDYDKFIILSSALAYSLSDFFKDYKLYVENNKNKVPLGVQEYCLYISEAQGKNPEIINIALDTINESAPFVKPVAYNTTVNYGSSGVGKTDALAVWNANLNKDDVVFLVGPTETQKNHLLTEIPTGIGYTISDLFDLIMDKSLYSELTDLNKNNVTRLYKNITDITEIWKLQTDKIEFKKLEKLPNKIIIDEFTYLNSILLLILFKFCKDNNVQLILMGDDNQLGNKIKPIGSKNTLLFYLTPRLSESLRILNVNKSNNLLQVDSILDEFRNAPILGVNQSMYDRIGNIQFKYYQDDNEITGDKIAEELTDSDIKSLKTKLNNLKLNDSNSGTVAYVGSGSSNVLSKLNDLGVNVVLLKENEIQGQEFDFVIVDIDWEFKIGENLEFAYWQQFLLKLYTMITRSKNATIIIDNGLTLYILNSVQTSNNITVKPITDLTEEFRKDKLNQIEKADIEEVVLDEVEETKKSKDITSNKPETSEENTESKKKHNPEPINFDGSNPMIENENANETSNEKQQRDSKKGEVPDYLKHVLSYMNIHFCGVTRSNNGIYTNENDSKRDWGIFMPKGEVLDFSKKEEGLDFTKEELKKRKEAVQKVQKYLHLITSLKKFLIFQKSDALDDEIKSIFDIETLKNPEYYIRVSDPQNEHLSGLTTLEKVQPTYKDRVYTVVAKFSNGFELTVAELANPDTWEKAITKKLNEAKSENKSTTKHEELLNDVKLYRDELDKIADMSEKGEIYYIDTPNFSKNIEFYRLDKRERLSNLSGEGLSKWDYMVNDFTVSDIFVHTKSIYDSEGKEIGKGHKSHAMLYVTLDPSVVGEMDEEYSQRIGNDSNDHSIRPIFLDNAGIDFTSLYNHNFVNYYKHTIKGLSHNFPVEAKPAGIRFYRAIWNYRASLINFLNYLEKRNMAYDSKEYLDLLFLESKYYEDAKLQLNKNYISESDFRNWVLKEHSDIYEKLKTNIWDINDAMSSDRLRRFRIGMDRQNNGIYVRKLSNLPDDWTYSENGLYINPVLGKQYLDFLNALFNNFLNKILPTNDSFNIEQEYDELKFVNKVTINLEGKEEVTTWYDLAENGDVTFKVLDENDNVQTIKVENQEILSALFPLLVTIARNLDIYSRTHVDLSKDKYKILLFEDIKNPDNYEDLDYQSIVDTLIKINDPYAYDVEGNVHDGDLDIKTNKTSFNSNNVGIVDISYKHSDGLQFIGWKDVRLLNLWRTMFHGLVNTSEYNNFEYEKDLRDTDAPFYKGIFIDPMLSDNYREGEDDLQYSSTNPMFFMTDVVPGFGTLTFSGGKLLLRKEKNLFENLDNVKPKNTGIKIEVLNEISKLKENVSLTDEDLSNYGFKISGKTTKNSFISSYMSKLKNLFEFFEAHVKDKTMSLYNENGNIVKLFELEELLELNTKTISDVELDTDSKYNIIFDDKTVLIINIDDKSFTFDIKHPNQNNNDSDILNATMKEAKVLIEKVKELDSYISTIEAGINYNVDIEINNKTDVETLWDNLKKLYENTQDDELAELMKDFGDFVKNEGRNCVIL